MRLRPVYLYISIFSIIASLACNKKEPNDFKNIMRTNYYKFIDFLPLESTNHFPRSIDSSLLYLNSNIPGFLEKKSFGGFFPVYLEVTFKYPDNVFNRLLDSIKIVSHSVFSTYDTSILLVFPYYYKSEDNPYEISVFNSKFLSATLCNHNFNKINGVPIPIFQTHQFVDTTIISRLNADFSIYVLEARPGLFLNEDYLSESDYLPKKWAHGFSRGNAINTKENLIIYWTIVW